VNALLLLLLTASQPPPVTATAEAKPAAIQLSEKTVVTLTVTGPAPLRVELPSPPLTVDSLQVWRIAATEQPTLSKLEDGRETWSQRFTLDWWGSGDKGRIAFVPVKVTAGTDVNSRDVPVSALDVMIDLGRWKKSGPLELEEARSKAEVRSIEELPPRPTATPESFVWLFLLGVVVVVAAMVVVGIVRRARRKPPPLPPLEWALAEFDRMERDAASGEVLADRVAAVLREFIARKFGVAAPKQTTAELLADANRAGWPPGLDGILERCDRAKFAGESPDADEGRELVVRAREWVELARRASEEQPKD